MDWNFKWLKRFVVCGVTPHVGVWIETPPVKKHAKNATVTPHVGVWIETKVEQFCSNIDKVTPHVGVWIETSKSKREECKN